MSNKVVRKKSSSTVPSVLKGPSETMSFVKDPEAYLRKKQAKYGAVFGGRVFHWPIVFAASYDAVQQVFNDDSTFFFGPGYSGFSGMQGLFAHTVLFMDQPHAAIERMKLEDCKLFSPRHVQTEIRPRIAHVTGTFRSAMQNRCSAENFVFDAYETTKNLNVDIMCHIFLGSQTSPNQFVAQPAGKSSKKSSKNSTALHVVQDSFKVETLSSVLWKGMQSLGYSGLVSSAYGSGESARNELMKMYTDAIGNHGAETAHAPRCPFVSTQAQGKSKSVGGAQSTGETWLSSLSREQASRYFILSTSSLVTKAVASLVTSFLIQLSLPENQHILEKLRNLRDQHESDSALELRKVIQEIERMFPPVLGCCRGTHASKESRTVTDGPLDLHDFAKGTKIWCSFFTANRDPTKYTNPDQFNPDRWSCSCPQEACRVKQIPCVRVPTPCTFGGGNRPCPGITFARSILEEVCGMFVDSFQWQLVSAKKDNLEYRWLPVGRPKGDALFHISLREPKAVVVGTGGAAAAQVSGKQRAG